MIPEIEKTLLILTLGVNYKFNMDEESSQLKEQVDQLGEELFLCRQDVERYRTESIALKNFIQTIYENCERLESIEDNEITLKEVLKNLKENIKTFGRDHRIRF